MPIAYSDIPYPTVSTSLDHDDPLRWKLEPIWRLAQYDHTAFPTLKVGLDKGLLLAMYLHNDLAQHIRALQPPKTHAQSTFSRPSLAMAISLLLFLFVATAAVVAYLGCVYILPLTGTSEHASRQLSRVYGAIRIALLQHTDPMDPYVLEILVGVWDVACAHPAALREHADIQTRAPGPRSRGHLHERYQRSLAWSLHKLKMAETSRLSCSNTSPVQNMPPEILSCVFEHLAQAHPYFERSTDGRDIWNISSHLIPRLVCRLWHEVIDQTTTLWPPLILGFGRDMTEQALRRSKEELLEFNITFSDSWTESHTLVLDHLRRISSFNASTASWDTTERLTMLLRGSAAPKMTAFEFLPSLHFSGDRIVLLCEDIFQAAPAENLIMLNIWDCTILHPSPLFPPSLVTLKLHRCDAWPNLNAMVDTLSRCTALRHFEWHMGQDALLDSGAHLEHTKFLTSTRQPATLPRMRLLDLECPIMCAAALMYFLVVSSSCRVTLGDDYTLTGVRHHDLGVLQDLLASLTASLGDHINRIFSQSHIGYDVISVSEDPDADAQKGALLVECRHTKHIHPFCSVSLCVSQENEGGLDNEVLSSILHSILHWPAISAGVTRFETNHEIFSSAALWRTVLDSLPHIRVLYLDNSAESEASDSVLALSQAISEAPGIAPTLTHIQLQGLSFPPIYQQRLAEAIRHRRDAGLPAIKLYVENCLDIGLDGDLQDIMRTVSGGALHPIVLFDSFAHRYMGPRDLLAEDD